MEKMQVMEQCVICYLKLTRDAACIKAMGVLQGEFFNLYICKRY